MITIIQDNYSLESFLSLNVSVEISISYYSFNATHDFDSKFIHGDTPSSIRLNSTNRLAVRITLKDTSKRFQIGANN